MVQRVITVEIDGDTKASIQRGLEEAVKKLDEAIDRSGTRVSQELLTALNRVARLMVREHGNPWNGRVFNNTSRLQRRSGASMKDLVDSVKVMRASRLENVRGEIAARFPLSFHEKGGTISAKSAQYLTIPLPAAMDSRGVPLRQRATDWENTFVARSRRGNLLIFQKRGLDIIPLYLLRRDVTIEGRLGFEDTMLEDGLPFFERKAFEAISEELEAA